MPKDSSLMRTAPSQEAAPRPSDDTAGSHNLRLPKIRPCQPDILESRQTKRGTVDIHDLIVWGAVLIAAIALIFAFAFLV